jgi:hypothetical protein
MSKPLTYKEYENLDKQEIDDVITELTKEFFNKYESMEFISLDFGDYWKQIDIKILNEPDWSFIPRNLWVKNSEIKLLVDWSLYIKNKSEGEWQTELYREMDDWFSFFRLPKLVPYIRFDDKY